MRDKDRRPAFDAREYFRIGCRREPARPQHGDAIAAIHLGLRRIAKVRADRPRRGRDEATRCKQRHAANQRWLIDCQTAGDPVTEGMSNQVHRTTADRLNDASDVTGQIVQGRAVERTATASDATHINRDRLEPSGNQRARQMIKIAGATARIREQHDWCAQTAKCAFQRRVTDLDGSMLHSLLRACPLSASICLCRTGRHIRGDRRRSCPSSLGEGEHRPKFLLSDVTKYGLYRWPKPDSIPERHRAWGEKTSIIVSMSLDFTECDRARLARDSTYDGRFYTGVHTTGVYCRPVCPVHPARSANVSFFPSAAAAEAAGFRPCLRCRPETAPFCSAWIGSRATVERALRLIVEDGALDAEGVTVERLAERLGLGARQLTRRLRRTR